MNPDLNRLYQIAHKSEKLIIGLMSGTSLDGLDVALCKIKGDGPSTNVDLIKFETVAYEEEVKIKIRKIFAKESIHFHDLCLLNGWIARLHAEIILFLLKKWGFVPEEIDIIASHGQTVFHAPSPNQNFENSTLQIGDGDHIALKTGIITLSDFRQKHVAAGGEGAPLAVYGDYFIFSSPKENRVMLNLGGIANFTFLPASLNSKEIIATDTGPANTLIDAVVRKYFPDRQYDEDGKIAGDGEINNNLLKELKKNYFFNLPVPKTTGPEMFNLDFVQNAMRLSKTENISASGLIATLTRLSAETIAECILKNIKHNFKLYISGGGAKNNVLTGYLKNLLPGFDIAPINQLGIDGDAKEAVLFAVLANECLSGRKNYFENNAVPGIKMGKISFPN